MALISEWMQQCGKKVLDNAGIVRETPVSANPLPIRVSGVDTAQPLTAEYRSVK